MKNNKLALDKKAHLKAMASNLSLLQRLTSRGEITMGGVANELQRIQSALYYGFTRTK